MFSTISCLHGPQPISEEETHATMILPLLLCAEQSFTMATTTDKYEHTATVLVVVIMVATWRYGIPTVWYT